MPAPLLMRRFRAAALILFASVSTAAADTLQDALAVAYASNPTIRAERARLKATEELKAQAWSGALPQIDAQAAYSRVKDTQSLAPGVFGPGGSQTSKFNPLTAGVSAEQPIFTGFRNLNAIRQAQARVRAGGAQLIGVEQDILRRVATAFFDVARDVTIYDSNLNNVEVLQRQKQEAELRFKVGEVTRTDVSQAEARLAGARASLATAQAQLAVSRSLYGELVGAPPGTLEADPALPGLPDSAESAHALARAYAPIVVGAREAEEASRRQVAIARGALAPTVSLTASYQYADQPSTFVTQDESLTYGVRASVPLFSGGLNRSRIREARALHDSARAQVDEAQRRAEAEVTATWERLVAARLTIDAASAQVEANELALEGVRREAQVGTRTTLDVLDAEQELLNAEVRLANAERDARVAAFELLAAAGVLNPDALGIDAASIIPTED
ncbi:MAG: TolC family outer membrane protein [Parvularculaceae bacterium]